MKTALVIEDNENSMVLITRLLGKHGYRTLSANTGYQGVRMALEQEPDFIILDIQLPDIEGVDVLKMIRAADNGKSVPIIAMTSFAMSGDRERLLSLGCNGYIEKPIDPELVIEQIRNILGE